MNERFKFDKKYLKDYAYAAGADEAGRGAGAGDVFAAAVCFSDIYNNAETQLLFEKLNDSKQLERKTRENLYELIAQNSIWAVYQGSVEDIARLNILKTSLLTMKRCIESVSVQLKSDNIIALIDGNKKIPQLKYAQETVIKGDCKSAAIAAASIMAKVSRDRYMNKLDAVHPEYGWRGNKGYMTKQHLDAVLKYGLSEYHRKEFFNKFFEKHSSNEKQLSLFPSL